MISQLSGRMPRLRSSASARPAARPVTTISSGELDRDHHAGQDVRQVLSHHLAVEEGLGEALPALHGASVPLDLADEGARALVGRVLEDRGGRPLLHDHARRP